MGVPEAAFRTTQEREDDAGASSFRQKKGKGKRNAAIDNENSQYSSNF